MTPEQVSRIFPWGIATLGAGFVVVATIAGEWNFVVGGFVLMGLAAGVGYVVRVQQEAEQRRQPPEDEGPRART